MANQVESGTMGGAASDSATAQGSVAASQDSAAAHRRSGDSAAIAAHGSVPAHSPHPTFHGRTVSWVAVSIMMTGFLVGALGLIFGHHGPTWWMFWVGSGLAVLGLLVALATNTFEDWY